MMNLARSDTYINVYLPREDGDDPRRWARPSSPVFHEEEVYKFSDEILKDRKLFLDKKHMSLYEIYYKDKDSGENSVGGTNPPSEGEHDVTDTEQRQRNERVLNKFALPRVTKVSISLDQKLRLGHRGRFNEQSISMTKSHLCGSQYNPAQTLERQVASFDVMKSANRRRVTSDNIKSAKARTEHISRLFKKVQSAPSEASKIRSLGLPPISRSSTSIIPDLTSQVSRPPSTHRTLPLRPSSKPYTIWRQTTNVLVPSSGGVVMLGARSGQSHVTSSRSRLHTASGIYV